MATADKGILGGFSGKVGTVVGAKWRNKDIMRSLPGKNRKPPSDKQLAQRARMGMVSEFLKPLRSITNAHFGQPADGKSRADLSLSYHLKKAVTEGSADFNIDYLRVIITKGELPGIHDLQITTESGCNLQCRWFDNSSHGLSETEDTLLAVFYNTHKKHFHIHHEARRDDAACMIQLPEDWFGDITHAWFSFVSIDREMAANSVYFGEIKKVGSSSVFQTKPYH